MAPGFKGCRRWMLPPAASGSGSDVRARTEGLGGRRQPRGAARLGDQNEAWSAPVNLRNLNSEGRRDKDFFGH